MKLTKKTDHFPNNKTLLRRTFYEDENGLEQGLTSFYDITGRVYFTIEKKDGVYHGNFLYRRNDAGEIIHSFYNTGDREGIRIDTRID